MHLLVYRALSHTNIKIGSNMYICTYVEYNGSARVLHLRLSLLCYIIVVGLYWMVLKWCIVIMIELYIEDTLPVPDGFIGYTCDVYMDGEVVFSVAVKAYIYTNNNVVVGFRTKFIKGITRVGFTLPIRKRHTPVYRYHV